MASIVLNTIGGALGGALGGSIGSSLLKGAGGLLGGFIDDKIFGSGVLRSVEGPRIADLGVQTSTYGRMIPWVYGNVRVAGNIIWSRPIKETATTTTTTAGGKGGGGGVTQSSTTYSYSVSLALAICEGEIDSVLRVWADAKQLDLSLGIYRIYTGNETQMPDAYIESFEGVGTTPAYRGLAYVVIEDFPLAEFGNRIPNFTFEIKRSYLYPDYNAESLEEVIMGMTLIPGSGEFVYDTVVQNKLTGEEAGEVWAQTGYQEPVNMHNPDAVANTLVALDQMDDTLPNLEWVSLVVTWFGDDLDAGECIIQPGVEYKEGGMTSPDEWSSGGYTRETARQITLVNGSPQYGGTPSDASVLRLISELKSRGYNIMFYPMFFMDVTDKPWRGRVSGSAADVASFFTKTDGYNDFIMHYANLVKGEVDAFVIGSELIGLTKVTDTPGSYPAVTALVNLAASVRAEMGGGVTLTYAADWSEYHHTDNGWYNLDPLWASPNIDVIGIDAYFPLTEGVQNGYDIEEVMAGWTTGEGYDFYYSDPERTNQQSLGAAYAWKNIAWWWENEHVNPDASTTDWEPESKKIWFTEYGFPSVDGATNQPNVFYDPNSSESFFPYSSRGRVDFLAQRTGLMATEVKWRNSDMIERMFIWTWDARPFPYWPDLLDVWADGGLWKTGHWVQGKLGISGLAAIVADICARVGLSSTDIDVSRLQGLVEGYIVATPESARTLIEQLMAAYFFDAVESDGVLKFVPREGASTSSIAAADLLPRSNERAGDLLAITRQQEVELPQRISIFYMNRLANYQQGYQQSERLTTDSRQKASVSLPIVMASQQAKVIADKALYASWMERTRYEANLPLKYATLEPTDIIDVTVDGVTHRMRITEAVYGAPGLMRIRGVAEDALVYDVYQPSGERDPLTVRNVPLGNTTLQLLDLPALPNDTTSQGVLRCAVTAQFADWNGAVIYRSDNNGDSYEPLASMSSQAVAGIALTVLADGVSQVIDEVNSVDVTIASDDTLESISELSMLNGGNSALLGDEIIQFRTATLLSSGKYRLSNLLRGRQGTEWAMDDHAAGERFVLLNSRLAKEPVPTAQIGLPRIYKAVSVGQSLSAAASQNFTYSGKAMRPLSPVHVMGTRDGTGNLTIDWVRRTRGNGEWRDYVDAPLNETSEAYEIDILDGETVVRTISGLASASASYSASAQTSDFGSPQANISIKIYQLSELIGRGYAAEVTV